MKLKIPPVLQFIIFSILMWIVTKVTTIHFTFERQKFISFFLFLIGIFINLTALYPFSKAKTTVNPLDPSVTSKLVVVGIYKYSRNPMYLGMLIGLMGGCILLGNYINITILVLFIWYISTFQIKPEEKILTTLFGEEYTLYCKKVRRWI